MQMARFVFESLVPADAEGRVLLAAADGTSLVDAVVEELPPPPPSYSEQEMEAMRRQAYEEGFMAGKNEGRREADHEAMQVQQALNEVLENVQQQLPDLLETQQNYILERTPELGTLVLNCAGKLALEALRKDPLSDIEAMIAECTETLMGKAELTIYVNPKLQVALARKLGKDVRIETKDDLAPGDCHITWKNGEAKREIDHIWSQIEEIIERYFAAKRVSSMSLPNSNTGEHHGG